MYIDHILYVVYLYAQRTFPELLVLGTFTSNRITRGCWDILSNEVKHQSLELGTQ